jgi:hypothetical protein
VISFQFQRTALRSVAGAARSPAGCASKHIMVFRVCLRWNTETLRGTTVEILNLVYVMTARAFYDWALREIDPLHPDVPRLVMRQHELDERARKLFGRQTRRR